MRTPRLFDSVIAACLAFSVSGCAKPGSPTLAASNTAQPAQAGKDFTRPIQVSQLRERSLATIEAAARDKSAEVRTNAMEAAGAAPSRLWNVIGVGLKDENPAVRAVATIMVGKHQIRELAAATRPLRDDRSPYVRAAAIFAGARCGEQVDPSPLASMVLEDPSPRLRSHAAFLLGEMGDKSAAGLLRQAARSPLNKASPAERTLFDLQVAEALVKLGDDDSLQPLRAALYPSRPEDLEGTALAVQILGNLRDRTSADQLIYLSAFRDPSGQYMPAEVRIAVATSLARIGLKNGSFIADQYWTSQTPAVRAQAAFAYGYIGGVSSMAKLDILLEDPDPRVRIAAAAGVLILMENAGGRGPSAT